VKTSEHRKHIPIGVRLHACLLLLGFPEEAITGGRIRWDHDPALSMRFEDPETHQLVPAPNEPSAIKPMLDDDHNNKSFGPGGEKRIHTRGSDVAEPRRLDRINKKHLAHLQHLIVPAPREDRPRSKWGKRKFQSRKKT
jgi:hypothetical protein